MQLKKQWHWSVPWALCAKRLRIRENILLWSCGAVHIGRIDFDVMNFTVACTRIGPNLTQLADFLNPYSESSSKWWRHNLLLLQSQSHRPLFTVCLSSLTFRLEAPGLDQLQCHLLDSLVSHTHAYIWERSTYEIYPENLQNVMQPWSRSALVSCSWNCCWLGARELEKEWLSTLLLGTPPENPSAGFTLTSLTLGPCMLTKFHGFWLQ